MRVGLLLLVLCPAGTGAQSAEVPTFVPGSDESLLNAKRRAIHRDAVHDKDTEDLLPQEQNENEVLLVNATQSEGVKASATSRKKSSWFWGGDEDSGASEESKVPGEAVLGSQPQASPEVGAEASQDSADAAENEDNNNNNNNNNQVDPDDPEGAVRAAVDAAASEVTSAVPLPPINSSIAQSPVEGVSVAEALVAERSLEANMAESLGVSANDSIIVPPEGEEKAKHRWSSLFQRQDDQVTVPSTSVASDTSATVTGGGLSSGYERVEASGDIEKPGIDKPDNKDGKNEILVAGEPAKVLQDIPDGLEISLGDPGNPERWAVMQRAGVPSSQFKCGVPDVNRLFQVSSLQAVSSLLISDDAASSRVDLDDSEDDMWSLHKPFHILGGGGGKGDGSDGDLIIQLKNFTISTELASADDAALNSTSAADILEVYTSPIVEAGGLVVTSNENIDIIYVCKATGMARIKLQATGTGGTSYCFEWVKHCSPSWDGFQVLETGTGRTVAEDGRVSSEWAPASTGNTVSFMLTHPGSEGSIRLKGASVSSSNPKVNATLRGAVDTILNETAPVANIITIVSDIVEQVDVIYSCQESDDEPAEVLLKVYNEAQAVPPLEIPWTAHCSNKAINEISATISSCRAKKTGSSLQQSQAMFKGEVTEDLQNGAVTIDADDDCTALLFSTDSPETVIELFPSHQLVYDRKMLMVSNKIGSVETTITGDTLLRFPYVCLDEGTSDVTLTVYFKNKSSADFHWKKACRKPGVHTSAMLTGNHIFAIIMALFLTSFLFCFISRSRTLTQFILRKLGDCCPWCCRRRQSSSSDERTQFTAFGVAV